MQDIPSCWRGKCSVRGMAESLPFGFTIGTSPGHPEGPTRVRRAMERAQVSLFFVMDRLHVENWLAATCTSADAACFAQ